MLELLMSPEAWIALATLAALEIVLGIDNVVFIAILTARLPPEQRPKAYRIGLLGAMATRLGLLFTLSWIMGLTKPLFTVMEQEISTRDLILIGGGLFLMWKSAQEIYNKVELHEDAHGPTGGKASFGSVIAQIMMLDIVFSLDSVITAVGMVKHVEIMAAAIIIAVIVMLVFAKPIGDFVNANPSIKILALSFLLLIGVLLLAEGFDQKISKGYVYFAMAYALSVELINLRQRKNTVRIREKSAEPASPV